MLPVLLRELLEELDALEELLELDAPLALEELELPRDRVELPEFPMAFSALLFQSEFPGAS